MLQHTHIASNKVVDSTVFVIVSPWQRLRAIYRVTLRVIIVQDIRVKSITFETMTSIIIISEIHLLIVIVL